MEQQGHLAREGGVVRERGEGERRGREVRERGDWRAPGAPVHSSEEGETGVR